MAALDPDSCGAVVRLCHIHPGFRPDNQWSWVQDFDDFARWALGASDLCERLAAHLKVPLSLSPRKGPPTLPKAPVRGAAGDAAARARGSGPPAKPAPAPEPEPEPAATSASAAASALPVPTERAASNAIEQRLLAMARRRKEKARAGFDRAA